MNSPSPFVLVCENFDYKVVSLIFRQGTQGEFTQNMLEDYPELLARYEDKRKTWILKQKQKLLRKMTMSRSPSKMNDQFLLAQEGQLATERTPEKGHFTKRLGPHEVKSG